MSYFYGYLRGTRGQATRCGSKKSGIEAHIRSWNNDVIARLFQGKDGKDFLILEIPEGLKVSCNRNIKSKVTD